MKSSKFFLFLTILLAPLYVVRFNVGSYPSTLLEALIGLTVVSWVFERRGVKGLKGINAPTTLFLTAAAISVFVSPDKRGAFGIFKAYFVEPLLIYLVIKDVVKSKKDWRLVFTALGLSGLWVALLAVFQGLTGWLTFAPHEALQGRAHAVYNTANAVGLYLGPLVALVLGPVMAVKSRGVRQPRGLVKNILYVALLSFAIIFSRSLGALVGLLAVIIYLGAHSAILHREISLERFWRPTKLVAASLILILGVWFLLNISNFTPRVKDPYVRKSSDTLQFRLCLWEGTRDLLRNRPVFGAGLSDFKELYAEKYFTCDAEPLEYPHNWVLNFWTETGLLGLIGFIWILWVYFKGLKPCLLNPKTKWLALGFSAVMVYWLIHGLVDVPYFKNDLALEFWVIVGLAETLGFVL